MFIIKKEFIDHYLERLTHRAKQELDEKLPESGFISELTPLANEVIQDIVKV
jgi:hypothetical protein